MIIQVDFVMSNEVKKVTLELMNDFPHIVADFKVLGGKPCIKGTRISVEFILEVVASGATIQSITEAYPQLSPQAVEEAIRYAARFSKNEIFVEVKSIA
jgi:uncharacterized protein (DUF433 family)